MSDSSWFLTPSVHEAPMQTLAEQCLLAQSAAAVHASPEPRGGQPSPPQSISGSEPLRTPSVHDGGAHIAPAQDPFSQSVAALHPRPSGQRGQSPPQSTSVSRPSFSPS